MEYVVWIKLKISSIGRGSTVDMLETCEELFSIKTHRDMVLPTHATESPEQGAQAGAAAYILDTISSFPKLRRMERKRQPVTHMTTGSRALASASYFRKKRNCVCSLGS